MAADLVAFLNSALDEDQRVAEAVRDRTRWRYSPNKYWRGQGIGTAEEAVFTGPAGRDAICICGTGEVDHPEAMARAAHIARWDPARVLAEVAAKRELLALHDDGGRDCVTCGDAGVVGYPCPTARALVAPFASRAGFDPSWLD